MIIAGENTDEIEGILLKPPDDRTSTEKKKISLFSKHMYHMYVDIRNVLIDDHCRGLSLTELKKKMNMAKIQEYFPYTEPQINYCLSFVELHIKIVR